MSPETVSFGKNLAVLNLDLMNVLIDIVRPEPAGQTLISNCSKWIDAVHQKPRPPLHIFTSLYFSNDTQPELKTNAPFGERLKGFGSLAHQADALKIAPDFNVSETDIVLQKTRWAATSGNALVNMLRASDVDTVIISGLSISGVVMSTLYHLLDLDIRVYVISDNVVELPLDQTAAVSRAFLDLVIPKLGCKALTLEEALKVLEGI